MNYNVGYTVGMGYCYVNEVLVNVKVYQKDGKNSSPEFGTPVRH